MMGKKKKQTTKCTQAYSNSSQGEERKKMLLLFEVAVCICINSLQIICVLFKCSRNATHHPLVISLAY